MLGDGSDHHPVCLWVVADVEGLLADDPEPASAVERDCAGVDLPDAEPDGLRAARCGGGQYVVDERMRQALPLPGAVHVEPDEFHRLCSVNASRRLGRPQLRVREQLPIALGQPCRPPRVGQLTRLVLASEGLREMGGEVAWIVQSAEGFIEHATRELRENLSVLDPALADSGGRAHPDETLPALREPSRPLLL